MLSKAKSAFGGITKIKNLLENFSGASPFFTFIIMVILVISGFYGWQKYQEYKFPEKAARGEIIGPEYYVKQIKVEIDKILEKKDIRGKRAIELAEGGERISDKAGLYSFEYPGSWKIIENVGAQGAQVSRLVIQNSYFSEREENKTKIIKKGAELSIIVTRGENKAAFSGKGGHAGLISSKNDLNVNGKENIYHVFSEPGYPNARILDDHIISGGNTYTFRLVYNQENFSDAEFTFQEILDSVKFLK